MGRKRLQLIWLVRHVLRKNSSALHVITHRLISQRLLIVPEKLKDHFEQHFSPRNIPTQPEIVEPERFPHILPPENVTINESLPDEEEIELVIKKQKYNKCQGTDKIYAEHLKYANSNRLVSAVLLLFTMIWTMVKVPESWLSSVITCLHKKGLKSIAKNYRSIFIMNTVSRLLPRLIIERLHKCHENLIMKNQFGFRQNRSNTEDIYIAR